MTDHRPEILQVKTPTSTLAIEGIRVADTLNSFKSAAHANWGIPGNSYVDDNKTDFPDWKISEIDDQPSVATAPLPYFVPTSDWGAWESGTPTSGQIRKFLDSKNQISDLYDWDRVFYWDALERPQLLKQSRLGDDVLSNVSLYSTEAKSILVDLDAVVKAGSGIVIIVSLLLLAANVASNISFIHPVVGVMLIAFSIAFYVMASMKRK